MPSAVAFLRAMNTGNRRITNDELCAHFVDLGYDGASAYQASGNVLLDVEDADQAERHIEEALAERLGYGVPTFVRSAAEVRQIGDAAPFTEAELSQTAGRVQVAILRTAPPQDVVEGIVASAPDEDRLVVSGRQLYWLPRAGLSDSALDVGAVEDAIGPMTIRTQGTVSRIARKLDPAGRS